MAYNVDTTSITHWLSNLIFAGQDLHDPRLHRLDMLLCCALKRPLSRQLTNQRFPEDLNPIHSPLPNHPTWIREALSRGQTVFRFHPTASLEGKIHHVLDWLDAAACNDEPWLSDCDQLGRPHKLMKLGSVDQAVAEADKAMRRLAAKPVEALGPEHIQTVKQFPDGAAIVKLLTTRALDAESNAMGHCVGLGAYDRKLVEGTHSFYSLRCASGKAHATMEVEERDNTLIQCQGKQNTAPVPKYLPYILDFAQEQQFRTAPSYRLPIIKQGDRFYDPHKLPENFRYTGDLDLSHSTVSYLPDGLTVTGSLNCTGSKLRELPARLSVGNHLDISDTQILWLPDNLRVPGFLSLHGTPIRTLPNALHVGTLQLRHSNVAALPADIRIDQDLVIGNTRIKELPPQLRIGRDLDISDSAVKTLPADIKIGRSLNAYDSELTTLPENLRIPEDFDATGSKLRSLPSGLRVGQSLDLSYTDITTLPPDLKIGANLTLTGCRLHSLPDNLHVPKALDLTETTLAALPKRLSVGERVMIDGQTRLPELPTYFSGKLHRHNPSFSGPDYAPVTTQPQRAHDRRLHWPTEEREPTF